MIDLSTYRQYAIFPSPSICYLSPDKTKALLYDDDAFAVNGGNGWFWHMYSSEYSGDVRYILHDISFIAEGRYFDTVDEAVNYHQDEPGGLRNCVFLNLFAQSSCLLVGLSSITELPCIRFIDKNLLGTLANGTSPRKDPRNHSVPRTR